MDLVLIEALEVDTVIGVYDWERTVTQTLHGKGAAQQHGILNRDIDVLAARLRYRPPGGQRR